MVENGVKTIVFASSASIYGDSELSQNYRDAPQSISYAITKLAGEYYINMFVREHNINGVVCRFLMSLVSDKIPSSMLAIPIFITKALSESHLPFMEMESK